VGAALRVVGRQDLSTGRATDDGSEFPRQIGDIAQARVHSLAEERRLQVRRVAGQEHPLDLEHRSYP